MSSSLMLWPEFSLVLAILAAMAAIMLSGRRTVVGYWVGLIGLMISGVLTVRIWSWYLVPVQLVGKSIMVDNFSLVVDGLVVLAGLATLLLAWNEERYGTEFPILLMLSVLGMMVLGFANSLIVAFLGIELLSLPLYILAASRGTVESGEAGLKYLLLGAFSSGILLFGLALLYGGAGTMIFTKIVPSHADPLLMAAGLSLTLVGLVFKLGAVPFHMWIPDVYEGSPLPVTNLMAFGTKVGAAAILMRFLIFGFYLSPAWWGPLLGYLAVLTMIAGNLLALPQNDLKRLLAYSGIGNAGYLLVGIASHNFFGAQAMLFYLLPYGLAVIGAFAVLMVVAKDKDTVTIRDLRGLMYRSPWLAGLFIVLMLSFAGIPLTGGFVGKFYLVQAALFADQPGYAIGIVIGTLVGLGAYLRPIQALFLREDASDSKPVSWTLASAVVLVVAVIGTIGLGVYPGPVVHVFDHSAKFYWLR